MKRPFKFYLTLVLAWLVFQTANIVIIYAEEGIVRFNDVKRWEPWLLTFILFTIIKYILDKRQKAEKPQQ